MFTGSGSLSIVKKDVANQRTPAIGFQKTSFAHKATAGDTIINLNSLTIPPEMSANGFSNPSTATIAAAQLLFYRKNLTLWSSLRGLMTDFYQYIITGSSTITFLGFTAEEGEIFQGLIDTNATTGSNVVASLTPPATGTLAAGQTDFNTGFAFQVNLYPATQSGAVYVYKNGQMLARNVGNATSSVSADGDYQEVDNGSGSGTIIRLNRPDPDSAATIQVIPSGRLAELPNGSMTATIELIQGQVNSMASYVSAIAGQTTTTILGSAPTQLDLKAFGDRVLAVEQNRARIDLSNTWTAYQAFTGITTGTAASNGQIGEVQTAQLAEGSATSVVNATAKTIVQITLTPGDWDVRGAMNFDSATGLTQIRAMITSTLNGIAANVNSWGTPNNSNEITIIKTNSAAMGTETLAIPSYRVLVTTTITLYLTAYANVTSGLLVCGFIEARRMR